MAALWRQYLENNQRRNSGEKKSGISSESEKRSASAAASK